MPGSTHVGRLLDANDAVPFPPAPCRRIYPPHGALPQDARLRQRLRRVRRARRPARPHAPPRRGDRRPAHRRRLRPVHRHRAAAAELATPMPSCASATPTAPRPGPAATPPAAWPICWRARPAAAPRSSAPPPATCPSEALPDGRVRVDMGPARLDWPRHPAGARRWTRCTSTSRRGRLADPAAASMGNPHATFFVADVERLPVAELGPRLEHDPLFPERANIGFAQILAPDRIRLRVWERGAGLTLRLRLRRLRGAGERAPARAGRPPRDRRGGRRRARDRMARGRPRADDRPGGDLLHRRDRPGGVSGMSVEILTFGCRLNAYESEVMRGHAAGAVRHRDRQHLRGDRRGGAPGAPGDPPRARASGPARASSSPAARRRSTRRRGRRCPASTACWATPTSCGRKAGRRAPPGAVSDIMAARETAAHLVTEFAGRARAFVQVQQGCDHRCTFCIIPFGRGPNRSVPVGAVVAQVRALVEAGYQEVVLTGVDIASLRRRPAGSADARASWCGGCSRWCRSCRGCGCRRSIRRRSTTSCGGCSARSRG